MKLLWLPGLIFLFIISSIGTAQESTKVYLFPGQGADYRQFQLLELPPNYDTVIVHYHVPKKGMSMREYALSLVPQIDTSLAFILIGVSLGGMLCSELNDILKPEKTILISSAKSRSELPKRYKFMRKFPIYKLIPKRIIKAGTFIAQPLFEPDRKKLKKTFVGMLKSKNPAFLKRTINMIVRWEKESFAPEIIHIHGTKDHTLPYKLVDADYTVADGSHMMVLTRSKEISQLIENILSSK